MDDCKRAHVIFLVLMLTVIGVPASFGADAAKASPKPFMIPEVALKGSLLPMHIDQINEHLQYYADMIRDAKDQATIDKGRTGLLRTFTYSSHASFQYVVAQRAVKIVCPLLDLPKPVKQINAALALSAMPQVTIQPALEKMVVHPNPAVRFLGWRGYRDAWVPIVGQGQTTAKKMFVSMDTRGRRENSPPVVGAIWVALMFRGTAVSIPEGMDSLDKTGLRILRNGWPEQCWRIHGGDVDMADAGLKGLATAVQYATNAIVAKKKQATTQAIQLIVDMMWCSAKAYGDAYKAGGLGKAVADANMLLLLECEKSLYQRLGLGPVDRDKAQGYLRVPLTSSKKEFEAERSDRVMFYVDPKSGLKYGVLAWVDDLEKRFGIESPTAERFQPKPASKPTTTPAKGK